MLRSTRLALLGVALAAGSAAAQLPPPGLEVGQHFPSVAFRDVESERAVSIDAFRGQKVLVAIFASW